MKRKLSVLLISLLAVIFTFSIAACVQGETTMSLSKNDTTLTVGATAELSVSTQYYDGQIQWVSSNTAIVTVSSATGNIITITAVAEGTATVTASAGDLEKSCTVTVTAAVVDTLPAYKQGKVSDLNDYKDLTAYSGARKSLLEAEIAIGTNAINTATTAAAVDTALLTAKSAMDALISGWATEDTLAGAKTTAIAAINALIVGNTDYNGLDTTQKAAIASVISTAVTAINAAVDTDAVTAAQAAQTTNVNNAIAGYKAANADALALSGAKTTAINAIHALINSQDPAYVANYGNITNPDQIAAIATLITYAENAINAAGTTAAVDSAKQAQITAITNAINGYHNANVLATAKTNAILAINALIDEVNKPATYNADFTDLSSEQKNAVRGIVSAATITINEAGSTDAVTSAKNTCISDINSAISTYKTANNNANSLAAQIAALKAEATKKIDAIIALTPGYTNLYNAYYATLPAGAQKNKVDTLINNAKDAIFAATAEDLTALGTALNQIVQLHSNTLAVQIAIEVNSLGEPANITVNGINGVINAYALDNARLDAVEILFGYLLDNEDYAELIPNSSYERAVYNLVVTAFAYVTGDTATPANVTYYMDMYVPLIDAALETQLAAQTFDTTIANVDSGLRAILASDDYNILTADQKTALGVQAAIDALVNCVNQDQADAAASNYNSIKSLFDEYAAFENAKISAVNEVADYYTSFYYYEFALLFNGNNLNTPLEQTVQYLKLKSDISNNVPDIEYLTTALIDSVKAQARASVLADAKSYFTNSIISANNDIKNRADYKALITITAATTLNQQTQINNAINAANNSLIHTTTGSINIAFNNAIDRASLLSLTGAAIETYNSTYSVAAIVRIIDTYTAFNTYAKVASDKLGAIITSSATYPEMFDTRYYAGLTTAQKTGADANAIGKKIDAARGEIIALYNADYTSSGSYNESAFTSIVSSYKTIIDNQISTFITTNATARNTAITNALTYAATVSGYNDMSDAAKAVLESNTRAYFGAAAMMYVTTSSYANYFRNRDKAVATADQPAYISIKTFIGVIAPQIDALLTHTQGLTNSEYLTAAQWATLEQSITAYMGAAATDTTLGAILITRDDSTAAAETSVTSETNIARIQLRAEAYEETIQAFITTNAPSGFVEKMNARINTVETGTDYTANLFNAFAGDQKDIIDGLISTARTQLASVSTTADIATYLTGGYVATLETRVGEFAAAYRTFMGLLSSAESTIDGLVDDLTDNYKTGNIKAVPEFSYDVVPSNSRDLEINAFSTVITDLYALANNSSTRNQLAITTFIEGVGGVEERIAAAKSAIDSFVTASQYAAIIDILEHKENKLTEGYDSVGTAAINGIVTTAIGNIREITNQAALDSLVIAVKGSIDQKVSMKAEIIALHTAVSALTADGTSGNYTIDGVVYTPANYNQYVALLNTFIERFTVAPIHTDVPAAYATLWDDLGKIEIVNGAALSDRTDAINYLTEYVSKLTTANAYYDAELSQIEGYRSAAETSITNARTLAEIQAIITRTGSAGAYTYSGSFKTDVDAVLTKLGVKKGDAILDLDAIIAGMTGEADNYGLNFSIIMSEYNTAKGLIENYTPGSGETIGETIQALADLVEGVRRSKADIGKQYKAIVEEYVTKLETDYAEAKYNETGNWDSDEYSVKPLLQALIAKLRNNYVPTTKVTAGTTAAIKADIDNYIKNDLATLNAIWTNDIQTAYNALVKAIDDAMKNATGEFVAYANANDLALTFADRVASSAATTETPIRAKIAQWVLDLFAPFAQLDDKANLVVVSTTEVPVNLANMATVHGKIEEKIEAQRLAVERSIAQIKLSIYYYAKVCNTSGANIGVEKYDLDGYNGKIQSGELDSATFEELVLSVLTTAISTAATGSSGAGTVGEAFGAGKTAIDTFIGDTANGFKKAFETYVKIVADAIDNLFTINQAAYSLKLTDLKNITDTQKANLYSIAKPEGAYNYAVTFATIDGYFTQAEIAIGDLTSDADAELGANNARTRMKSYITGIVNGFAEAAGVTTTAYLNANTDVKTAYNNAIRDIGGFFEGTYFTVNSLDDHTLTTTGSNAMNALELAIRIQDALARLEVVYNGIPTGKDFTANYTDTTVNPNVTKTFQAWLDAARIEQRTNINGATIAELTATDETNKYTIAAAALNAWTTNYNTAFSTAKGKAKDLINAYLGTTDNKNYSEANWGKIGTIKNNYTKANGLVEDATTFAQLEDASTAAVLGDGSIYLAAKGLIDAVLEIDDELTALKSALTGNATVDGRDGLALALSKLNDNYHANQIATIAAAYNTTTTGYIAKIQSEVALADGADLRAKYAPAITKVEEYYRSAIALIKGDVGLSIVGLATPEAYVRSVVDSYKTKAIKAITDYIAQLSTETGLPVPNFNTRLTTATNAINNTVADYSAITTTAQWVAYKLSDDIAVTDGAYYVVYNGVITAQKGLLDAYALSSYRAVVLGELKGLNDSLAASVADYDTAKGFATTDSANSLTYKLKDIYDTAKLNINSATAVSDATPATPGVKELYNTAISNIETYVTGKYATELKNYVIKLTDANNHVSDGSTTGILVAKAASARTITYYVYNLTDTKLYVYSAEDQLTITNSRMQMYNLLRTLDGSNQFKDVLAESFADAKSKYDAYVRGALGHITLLAAAKTTAVNDVYTALYNQLVASGALTSGTYTHEQILAAANYYASIDTLTLSFVNNFLNALTTIETLGDNSTDAGSLSTLINTTLAGHKAAALKVVTKAPALKNLQRDYNTYLAAANQLTNKTAVISQLNTAYTTQITAINGTTAEDVALTALAVVNARITAIDEIEDKYAGLTTDVSGLTELTAGLTAGSVTNYLVNEYALINFTSEAANNILGETGNGLTILKTTIKNKLQFAYDKLEALNAVVLKYKADINLDWLTVTDGATPTYRAYKSDIEVFVGEQYSAIKGTLTGANYGELAAGTTIATLRTAALGAITLLDAKLDAIYDMEGEYARLTGLAASLTNDSDVLLANYLVNAYPVVFSTANAAGDVLKAIKEATGATVQDTTDLVIAKNKGFAILNFAYGKLEALSLLRGEYLDIKADAQALDTRYAPLAYADDVITHLNTEYTAAKALLTGFTFGDITSSVTLDTKYSAAMDILNLVSSKITTIDNILARYAQLIVTEQTVVVQGETAVGLYDKDEAHDRVIAELADLGIVATILGKTANQLASAETSAIQSLETALNSYNVEVDEARADDIELLNGKIGLTTTGNVVYGKDRYLTNWSAIEGIVAKYTNAETGLISIEKDITKLDNKTLIANAVAELNAVLSDAQISTVANREAFNTAQGNALLTLANNVNLYSTNLGLKSLAERNAIFGSALEDAQENITELVYGTDDLAKIQTTLNAGILELYRIYQIAKINKELELLEASRDFTANTAIVYEANGSTVKYAANYNQTLLSTLKTGLDKYTKNTSDDDTKSLFVTGITIDQIDTRVAAARKLISDCQADFDKYVKGYVVTGTPDVTHRGYKDQLIDSVAAVFKTITGVDYSADATNTTNTCSADDFTELMGLVSGAITDIDNAVKTTITFANLTKIATDATGAMNVIGQIYSISWKAVNTNTLAGTSSALATKYTNPTSLVDSEYYVEVASNLPADANITSLTIGSATFNKNQTVKIAVGAGNGGATAPAYETREAYYVNDNKLYVAIIILGAEMVTTADARTVTIEFAYGSRTISKVIDTKPTTVANIPGTIGVAYSLVTGPGGPGTAIDVAGIAVSNNTITLTRNHEYKYAAYTLANGQNTIQNAMFRKMTDKATGAVTYGYFYINGTGAGAYIPIINTYNDDSVTADLTYSYDVKHILIGDTLTEITFTFTCVETINTTVAQTALDKYLTSLSAGSSAPQRDGSISVNYAPIKSAAQRVAAAATTGLEFVNIKKAAVAGVALIDYLKTLTDGIYADVVQNAMNSVSTLATTGEVTVAAYNNIKAAAEAGVVLADGKATLDTHINDIADSAIKAKAESQRTALGLNATLTQYENLLANIQTAEQLLTAITKYRDTLKSELDGIYNEGARNYEAELGTALSAAIGENGLVSHIVSDTRKSYDTLFTSLTAGLDAIANTYKTTTFASYITKVKVELNIYAATITALNTTRSVQINAMRNVGITNIGYATTVADANAALAKAKASIEAVRSVVDINTALTANLKLIEAIYDNKTYFAEGTTVEAKAVVGAGEPVFTMYYTAVATGVASDVAVIVDGVKLNSLASHASSVNHSRFVRFYEYVIYSGTLYIGTPILATLKIGTLEVVISDGTVSINTVVETGKLTILQSGSKQVLNAATSTKTMQAALENGEYQYYSNNGTGMFVISLSDGQNALGQNDFAYSKRWLVSNNGTPVLSYGMTKLNDSFTANSTTHYGYGLYVFGYSSLSNNTVAAVLNPGLTRNYEITLSVRDIGTVTFTINASTSVGDESGHLLNLYVTDNEGMTFAQYRNAYETALTLGLDSANLRNLMESTPKNGSVVELENDVWAGVVDGKKATFNYVDYAIGYNKDLSVHNTEVINGNGHTIYNTTFMVGEDAELTIRNATLVYYVEGISFGDTAATQGHTVAVDQTTFFLVNGTGKLTLENVTIIVKSNVTTAGGSPVIYIDQNDVKNSELVLTNVSINCGNYYRPVYVNNGAWVNDVAHYPLGVKVIENQNLTVAAKAA